ncbi:hypothetical protein RCOM_1466330 [Ricinus communis]|uniref:Uncharacterized protein n=1 Tax=Ricinus communis TaxID=3988 RepID=B9RLF0_RICCO|nr:hypothetical protein RCOM_1466330 [Ricinus communis]
MSSPREVSYFSRNKLDSRHTRKAAAGTATLAGCRSDLFFLSCFALNLHEKHSPQSPIDDQSNQDNWNKEQVCKSLFRSSGGNSSGGEVVEAALSAICTLLDDKVDVDNCVSMLRQANALQHVLNVVKENREEGLWHKSIWFVEKFLMTGDDKSASNISQDRLLPANLISAFHHGNGSTRQMAEKILRFFNKLPSYLTSSHTM